MRKLGFLAIFALVVSLLVAPLSAQETFPDFIQHTECEVDLSGQTVTIYHFGDLTGPYAFITQPLLAGLSDAIAYFNARGGVCGAELAQDFKDTAGNPAQTQAHYDFYRALEPKPQMMVLYASGDAELLRSQVEADQIPIIISAGSVEGLYGEDGRTPGWIYATNPLYADQLGAFCDFVSANPAEFPDPVIGYVSWGGAFGEAAYTPEVIAHCAEAGVTILDQPQYFRPTDTDISTQVLNAVDAGANILYTNSLASGPALLAKTVVDLGLEDDVKLAGVNWALDTSVGLLSRTSIGSDGLPAVNGIYGSLPFHWWSEVQLPGIQLLRQLAQENERGLPVQNIAYILGATLVDYYTEIYIITANRVGSLADITGADIKETIESTVYSPLGLYTVDFMGGELRAVSANRIAQMFFANATMSGVATSGDDALKVPNPDGTTIYVPVLAPRTQFAPAPDLRPGGE
jgi:branched-chain amino acid transport system substrate-binding protein